MIVNQTWSVLSSSGSKEKVLCFRGKVPSWVLLTPGEVIINDAQVLSLSLLPFLSPEWSLSIVVLHCAMIDVWDRVIYVAYSICFQHCIYYGGCMCCICFITRKLCQPLFISPNILGLKKRKKSHLHRAHDRRVNEMVLPSDNLSL